MGNEIQAGRLPLLAALAYDNDERLGLLTDAMLATGLTGRGPAAHNPEVKAYKCFPESCISL